MNECCKKLKSSSAPTSTASRVEEKKRCEECRRVFLLLYERSGLSLSFVSMTEIIDSDAYEDDSVDLPLEKNDSNKEAPES